MEWLGRALLHAPLVGGEQDLIAGSIGLCMVVFYALPLVIKLILDRLFPRVIWLRAIYLATVSILCIIYLNTASPDFFYIQF